ncbi:MAG: hypothetical protein GY711_06395 [bacterium]|nr:hypothetical protein [bacterium]
MQPLHRLGSCLFLVLSILAGDVLGQVPVRLDAGSWTGPRPKSGSAFGSALAASDFRILVGAPFDSHAAWRGGAAYVFERVGPLWLPAVRLVASDAGPDDQFGHAVALSADGTTAFVAAWLAAGSVPTTGAVYVFERGAVGWHETQKLFAAAGAPNDGFGTALAVDGDRLAVGAAYTDRGAFLSGSVYVFERSAAWCESAELVPQDPEFLAEFGAAVALRGDRIAAGAPRVADTGAAYVFERSAGSWSQTARLEAQSPSLFARFGAAVDLEGDMLAIGAPGAERVAVWNARGGVWSWMETLGVDGGGEFGARVALGTNGLLVGAPGVGGRGLAYGFVRRGVGWSRPVVFEPAGLRTGDRCGEAVGWSMGEVLVGVAFGDLAGDEGPGEGVDVGVVWVL